MRGVRNLFRWCGLVLLVAISSTLIARANASTTNEPTVEDLKTRLSSATAADKTRICLQIAQMQLIEADKFYAAQDSEKAQPALTDVVEFSEKARDYSIQSHKNQKQTEIAVRVMARKLTDLMHSLPHDEQTAVREAITRLQRVRDDLLVAMFPKGAQ
jgi:ATP phosphoribosyltransferase